MNMTETIFKDRQQNNGEITTLEGKQKTKWTRIFLLCMAAVLGISISVMNYHYDSLARYPYRDEESRRLIKEYLNDEEIDYIIEYSIAPNMFISFIEAPGFNIYHAAEYKRLSLVLWQETPAHIVRIVEDTWGKVDSDTLQTLLSYDNNNYSCSEFEDWIENGDSYAPDARLLINVNGTSAFLTCDLTIGKREAKNLVNIAAEDATIPVTDSSLQVTAETMQALKDLFAAYEAEVQEQAQAEAQSQTQSQTTSLEDASSGLEIGAAYISYKEQEERFNNGESKFKPGQDEHQLGTSVDFEVDGLSNAMFEKTWQCQWLEDNAWKYGFVETYTAEDEELSGITAEPYHYRYVGKDLAEKLHENGLTLFRYDANQDIDTISIAR